MMMNNWKRAISFLLLLCVLSAGLLACGEPESTDTTAQTGENETGDVTDAVTTEPEEIVYKANVPDVDYEGRAFRTLVFQEGYLLIHGDVDFLPSEESAEPVSNAAYIRKRAVEETCGVTFDVITTGNMTIFLRNTFNANADVADICCPMMTDVFTLSQEGILANLNEIPNLDLTEPWWDQNSVKDLAMGDSLYAVTGDYGSQWKGAITCMFFNKDLYETLGYEENLYDLVANYEWTFDKYTELVRQGTKEMNGEPDITSGDIIGMLSSDAFPGYMLLASGVRFTKQNDEGYPELAFYNDKTVDAFTKIYNIATDLDNYRSIWLRDGNMDNPVFKEGGSVFSLEGTRVAVDYRDMEDDFGILPLPMYNKEQHAYYHSIASTCAQMFSVPALAPDLEFVGTVSSVLGAESKNVLTPAFYDKTLMGKGARDEESKISLDMIFDTVVYDIGYLYNFGGIGLIADDLVSAFDDGIASEYAAVESAALTAIEETVLAYRNQQA